MKDHAIVRILSVSGILILIVNLFFHLFGLEAFMHPDQTQAVMTLFTSASLFLIYTSMLTKNRKWIVWLLTSSIFIQILSVFMYYSSYRSENTYLLSSSLPTLIFIMLSCVPLIIVEKIKYGNKIQSLIGPTLLLYSVIFLFLYISKNLSILGFKEGSIGIGLNIYTLSSFFIVSTISFFNDTKLVSLDPINISFRPIRAMFFLLFYSLINFLLLYCKSQNVLISALIIHMIFLTVSYLFFIKPFLRYGDNLVTICSWSRKIRTEEGVWINQEEHFSSLGLSVTHGIAPDELIKIKTSIE